MNYRTVSQMDYLIRKNIFLIPREIDYVVGVPRSGMLPATIIATLINKPLLTIDQYLNNSFDLVNVSYRTEGSQCFNRILIVEDSCNTGNSLGIIREKLQNCPHHAGVEAIFMCIFATSASKDFVDVFLDICEQPRVFEWNIMNHYYIQRACFDMDGVLCVDPTDEQNDDGERYIDFIKNTQPLFIPKFKIGAIVTSRLEKYRKDTEEWLEKHGVKYDNLIMLNLPDKETRIKMGAHAPFKASVYNSFSNAILYYESNDSQAKQIAELTGKPVYCVESNALYQNENKVRKENSFVQYKENKAEIDDVINQIDQLFEYMDEGVAFLRSTNHSGTEEYEDVLRAVVECITCVSELYKTYQLENNDQELIALMNDISSGTCAGLEEAFVNTLLSYDYRNSRFLITHALMNRVREYSGHVTMEDWNKENQETLTEIIRFLSDNDDVSETNDYQEEISYLRKRGKLELYPYPFIEKYNREVVQVFFDDENQYKYVLHKGKRLYFPPNDDELIRKEYNQLVMEQDEQSPHCYFNETYYVDEDTVFVDVGAAEAIVSLDVVDVVKEVYLIECDPKWVKALNLTFRDYLDKVHIIPKYAGYIENESTSSIDSILSKYSDQKIFIKMDIEGMELECLESCCDVMSKNQCTFACTTYHTDDAEEQLKRFFERNNYPYEMSRGYMLFYWGRLTMLNGYYKRPVPPYFRKCLIRAKR